MVTKNYLKHIEDTYRSAGVPKPLRGPAATRLFRGSNPFPRFIFLEMTMGVRTPIAARRTYEMQTSQSGASENRFSQQRPRWASALSEVEL